MEFTKADLRNFAQDHAVRIESGEQRNKVVFSGMAHAKRFAMMALAAGVELYWIGGRVPGFTTAFSLEVTGSQV